MEPIDPIEPVNPIDPYCNCPCGVVPQIQTRKNNIYGKMNMILKNFIVGFEFV